MNFSDEPYVRLFIRRTLTNKRLGWEGRAVMHEMLYEFDRAGVFEFDGDLAGAVEVMTQLPEKAVRVGLKRLLDSKTWLVRDRYLVWPNFLDAQTCERSDKARQRDSRERRRAMAHAAEALGTDAPSHPAVIRDDPSRPVTEKPEVVTNGHVGSQAVTLSRAEPNLAEQSTHTDARESPGLQAKAEKLFHDPTRSSHDDGAPETWVEVIAAFDAFSKPWGTGGKLRTRDTRATLIAARFSEGFTVQDLADAALGAKLDDHIAGHPSFQTLETVWKDAGRVEKYKRLLTAPPVAKPKSGRETGPVQADTFIPKTRTIQEAMRDASK